MTFTMRDGSTVLDNRLGRLPEFDQLSRNFPIRTLFDGPRKLRSYTWNIQEKYILDQGNEGSCVGHGFAHDVTARPVKFIMTHDDALWVYNRAKFLDQYSGEDYDGTTVLAGAKATVELGHYKEYRWAFSEHDMALAVAFVGPVVIGINWYEGMFRPDSDGYLNPTGRLAGGHCVIVNAININQSRYRIVNSWGLGWGERGQAWISRSDMDRLLMEDGECCLPLRVKVKNDSRRGLH